MKSRSLLILFVVFQYFSFSTELASSSKTTLLQKVFVKEIRIVNSSIFARADFEGLFTSYEKRDLQFEEMEELRSKASEAYLEKGFINSGFILDDRIIDGVIILRAIEGDLSKIEISGNGYFKPDFLRKRLKRHAGKPFNLLALQRSLQKLRYDQRIKRLRAKFSPGVGQGSGVLDLKLKEHQPFKWTVHGGNDKPQIGRAHV